MRHLFGLVIMPERAWLDQTLACYKEGKKAQKFHGEGGYASQLKRSQEKVAKMAHLLDSRDALVERLISRVKEVSPLGEKDPAISSEIPSDFALNEATVKALQWETLPFNPEIRPPSVTLDGTIDRRENIVDEYGLDLSPTPEPTHDPDLSDVDAGADFDEVGTQVGNEDRANPTASNTRRKTSGLWIAAR